MRLILNGEHARTVSSFFAIQKIPVKVVPLRNNSLFFTIFRYFSGQGAATLRVSLSVRSPYACFKALYPETLAPQLRSACC